MIAITKPTNELRRQWRQQILAHCKPRHVETRRGFAAMTIVDQANTSSRFIDINDLLVVLVHEDDTLCYDRRSLRLSGYNVSRIPGGVQFGGAENCRIYKDLTLAPQHRARGQRLDRSKNELLALKLDHRLGRAARHSAGPWPGLRLPQLWAGFRARHAGVLRGDGPEFERACRQQCRSANELFLESARQVAGLTAFPLDWLAGQTDSATAIFAEVTPGLRRQVCRIQLPEGLIGYQGTSAYDFFSSRFRRRPGGRRQVLIKQKPSTEPRLIRTESFVA
jgi:hypothetical protein